MPLETITEPIYGHIYRLTNRVTGKVYIGMTTIGVAERFKRHCRSARRGIASAINDAIRKHGADAFSIETLTIATTDAELSRLEVEHIALARSTGPYGYNMTFGGEGMRATPEVRARLSATALVSHNTPETLARHRVANKAAAIKPGRRAKLKATLACPVQRAGRSTRATEQNARLRGHLSDTTTASWEVPEVRTARQAGQRAWWASRTPEQREAHRQATREGRGRAGKVPAET